MCTCIMRFPHIVLVLHKSYFGSLVWYVSPFPFNYHNIPNKFPQSANKCTTKTLQKFINKLVHFFPLDIQHFKSKYSLFQTGLMINFARRFQFVNILVACLIPSRVGHLQGDIFLGNFYNLWKLESAFQ